MTVFVTEYMAALADLIDATRVVRTVAVLADIDDDLVVIGPDIDLPVALEFSATALVSNPARGVVLVRKQVDAELLTEASRAGIRQVVRQADTIGLHRACAASRVVSERVRRAA